MREKTLLYYEDSEKHLLLIIAYLQFMKLILVEKFCRLKGRWTEFEYLISFIMNVYY